MAFTGSAMVGVMYADAVGRWKQAGAAPAATRARRGTSPRGALARARRRAFGGRVDCARAPIARAAAPAVRPRRRAALPLPGARRAGHARLARRTARDGAR